MRRKTTQKRVCVAYPGAVEVERLELRQRALADAEGEDLFACN